MSSRLERLKSMMPANTTFDPTLHVDTNLYAIIFRGNESVFQNFTNKVVTSLDSNADGQINKTEVRDNILTVFGQKRTVFTRLVSKFISIPDTYFDTVDSDGNGTVSGQELTNHITKFVHAKISLPADYQKVCDFAIGQANTCDLSNSTISESIMVDLANQEMTCKSGFSWIFKSFETEECLVKASKRSADKCANALHKCFLKSQSQSQTFLDTAVTSVSGNTNGTLHKRNGIASTFITSSTAVAGRTTFLAFLTDLWIVIPVIIVASLIFLGSFYLAIELSSQSSIKKYWHQETEAERWQIGQPLPPCGTPYIFWSDKCGAIASKTARTCPEGQPWYRQACRSWWTHGSRTCSFLGCQPLCYNVSTNGCPKGQGFQLGYDEKGKSVVIPYQQF